MRQDDLQDGLQGGLQLQHDIALASPALAEAARCQLQQLPGVTASCPAGTARLQVCYRLRDYTLEQLEAYLCAAGYPLDPALPARIQRALIHYREALQRDTQCAAGTDSKRREIAALLYPRHPHGNADDTPEELRHYH